MISLTKIFRFEMAHAIYGYPGACANIHGHTYELHVTVASNRQADDKVIEGTGLILDFKELKRIVHESVISKLDHKLVLSKYAAKDIRTSTSESLVVLEFEPTAENLLIFIKDRVRGSLPAKVILKGLLLKETEDSYAEWLPL